MCRKKKKTKLHRAFTLIEMLLTMSLVALLAGLTFPAIETLGKRAESTACSSNLRQIGLALMQKVQDNGGIYPYVEGDPADPVHAPQYGAQSIADTLRPYGITDKVLRCPSDAKDKNYFGSRGCSYDWFSYIDGERIVSAKIDLSGGTLVLPLMRFPITGDYELVHNSKRMNILFADGHVDPYTGPGVREDVKREVQNATQ